MSSDPDSYLETGHLQQDLRARSISGAAVTLTTQWVKFALHLGSLWVLARLLTPGDFGLFGMVVAITGFILLFKDLGLATATVQRAEVSHAQVSTLFWINIALSAAIMVVTMLAAPLIAWFYGDPRLIGITLALSCAFLLGGATVQHLALLSRQMRFRALAVVEIISYATAAAAALLAAFLGARYWALVVQQLTLAMAMTIGVWTACRWRPGRPVRRSGVRPLLRFGGNLTLFGVLNYFARHLDDVLIGRFWGAAALGFYTKAYSLLLLPLRQINAPVAQIAVPTLSRLQDQPDRYRRYYLNALRLIALATMPSIALLFVIAREVVYLVLGPQWNVAGELFSIMAVAAFVQPVLATGGWIYVSMGQANRMARWGGLFALLYCVSFGIGLPWGVRGVALAYSVAVWLLAVTSLWAAFRRSPVRVGAALGTVAPAAVMGLVVAATGWQIRRWLLPAHPALIVALCAIAAILVTALLVGLWPALRRDLRGALGLFGELRAGRKTA
jgi:PST family polysaccharide transporter